MSGSNSEWFSGADSPFLEALRRLAPKRLAGLVDADDTVSYPLPIAPLVQAEVPGVGAEPGANGPSLQVLWHNGVLGGYWCDNHYLWDDFDERQPESFVVKGVPLMDDEAASLAVDWLARQLTRPIEVREWQRGGVAVGRAWVLVDSGVQVGTQGPRRKRLGPPTSTEVVRPMPST